MRLMSRLRRSGLRKTEAGRSGQRLRVTMGSGSDTFQSLIPWPLRLVCNPSALPMQLAGGRTATGYARSFRYRTTSGHGSTARRLP